MREIEETRAMNQTPCDVKVQFLLADRMIVAARCVAVATPEAIQGFRAALLRERDQLRALSNSEIDARIGDRDQNRLRRYDAAGWVREIVDLSACLVHDRMGNRDWLRESFVPDAAARILSIEGQESRVVSMKEKVALFLSDLPVIILAGQSGMRIDDGSHRAVALWLAGHGRVKALVGRFWTMALQSL